jgi:VCBS repeat-containing protein
VTTRRRIGALALGAAFVSALLTPMTVLAVAPTAVDDDYTVAEDVLLTVGAAAGVLANDTPGDGGVTTVAEVAGPAHGTLTLDPDGSFTYQPALNWSGNDAFTYQAEAGGETSGSATVTIHVTALNDPPTTVPDTYSTNEDSALNRNQPGVGVKANDSDPEGDTFTVALLTQASNGTVSNFGTNGTFRYAPVAFFGTDSFTYRDRQQGRRARR